jgi:hypothetical protein
MHQTEACLKRKVSTFLRIPLQAGFTHLGTKQKKCKKMENKNEQEKKKKKKRMWEEEVVAYFQELCH